MFGEKNCTVQQRKCVEESHLEAQIEWATSRGILGEWSILDGKKTLFIWRNVGLRVRRNFIAIAD